MHDRDDGHGNARRNEPIFDGGSPRFVSDKLRDDRHLQRLQSARAGGKMPPVLLWLSRCGAGADRIEAPLRGG